MTNSRHLRSLPPDLAFRTPHATHRRNLAAAWALPAMVAALTAVHAGASTWQAAPSLPAAKQHAFGVLHEGSIYAIGGTPWVNEGDQDGSVVVLGGAAWSFAAPLDGTGPTVPIGGGVDGLNRIIFFGGISLDNGDTGKNKVYDPLEGASTSIADPGDLVEQLGFAFAADDLGRLYWLGGGVTPGISAHCERYSAQTNSWTVLAPLPAPVTDACACDDGAGHILVFGGVLSDGLTRTADVKRFDIASGTWSSTAVPDMPSPVSGARAVLGADNRVYVIGGLSAAGSVQSGVQVLNLFTNTWSFGPSLATARYQFAAVRGADNFIYVIGGTGAAGAGLASVERLATTPCPEIPDPPSTLGVWAGQTAAISAAVSGGQPMSYAWFKDGQPLEDGPTGTGSTVTGTDSATLVITSVGSDDAGTYEVEATNECGSVSGPVAMLVIKTPPTVPSQWTIVNLHPSWATSSWATALSNGFQAGTATIDTPEYLNLGQAVLWSGTAESAANVTPAGSVGGGVLDMESDTLAGWWWWPYQCYVSGQWYTCYSQQPAMWLDGAFDNLQVSGWEYGSAGVVRNGIVGGTITTDDEVGNVWSHGGIWQPPNYWFLDLHPGGIASSSSVTALDGDKQFGSILTPYPGPTYHAAMWSGTPASFVDLHPAGFSASFVADAHDGLQAGNTGYPYDGAKACSWTGSVQSFRLIHPTGSTLSHASAVSHGLIFGDATIGGVTRPIVWRGGGPDDYVDLQVLSPPGFSSVSVNDIEIDDDGTFRMVGSGYNAATGRTEALLWISTVAPAGDLDGDGDVDGADLGLLLALWGTADPLADLNSDGVVDGADLGVLLAAWG